MSRRARASLAAALLGLAAPVTAHGQSDPLPEGAGKPMVEGVCAACHGVNLVQNSSGYTREGWEELILTMIDLSGSPELETITEYLATHFPENTKRAPTLMPGEVSIKFQEWKAPTLGQRTRDPVQAPDGSIWWSGQWSDLVGRVDPETGEIREFPLPPGSKPHTVTADRDGNIWYTGNGNGTMGRLDPRTGEVTVYPMPDPDARDPHSAIVDQDGTVWFTLQHSNMVGRLIPATGEVELVTMPTAESRPYGIKLCAEGVPGWRATAATGCTASIRRRWRSGSTPCRTRRRPCGGSPSRATARSGT